MRHKIAVVGFALVLVSAALAASAFTTGSVSRASNVNVVSDDTGLIALSDGTSGGLVYQNASGALEIDFTQGGATGVNTEAHFELGDPNDAANKSAFNITNQDTGAHDVTVSYTGVSESEDGDANIEFRIYDSTGSQVATVSEESTSATVTDVASGATHYVVIVVDTYGVSTASDLSGTLEVSV